jgi:1,4-dihydroxy-6-naphthoate synthase
MALEFSRKWGRGIDQTTNEKFVRMYVNKRTVDYEDDGRDAVRLFLERGQQIGLVREDFEVDKISFLGLGD